MGTAQWLYAVPIVFFIEWGVAVLELCDVPFWSQSFCFAQTDGTGIIVSSYRYTEVPFVYGLVPRQCWEENR